MATIRPSDPPIFGSVDEMMLAIMKNFFQGQDVHCRTQYTEGLPTPLVVVRRDRRSGTLALRSRDERFLQPAIVSVNTITSGIDADEQGEELQEMCRFALEQAQALQMSIPNCGSIAIIEGSTFPAKAADWQTATSVVQYASLPKGSMRYESVYRVLIRPPDQSTITNRFKPSS